MLSASMIKSLVLVETLSLLEEVTLLSLLSANRSCGTMGGVRFLPVIKQNIIDVEVLHLIVVEAIKWLAQAFDRETFLIVTGLALLAILGRGYLFFDSLLDENSKFLLII
jgi:hypothetical protein